MDLKKKKFNSRATLYKSCVFFFAELNEQIIYSFTKNNICSFLPKLHLWLHEAG